MKLRKSEIIIIVIFAVLSIASLATAGIYYYNYYQEKYDRKQTLLAAEKSQKEAAERAKKEALEKAKREEKQRKRLERIEAAKGLVIPAYTQFLLEYRTSTAYSLEGDRYFIYDLDSDGIPELFLTTAAEESTFLRDYTLYRFGLVSQEVENVASSTEPVLSFFTGDNSVFTYSRDSYGKTVYNRYKLSGKELKKKEAGSYQYQSQLRKCYVDGVEKSAEEYATAAEDFHQKFIKNHAEIQEYALADSTPLDAYMPEANINESVTIPATNAINNKYNGKLLFHPEEVTDMEDYYQVTGELWQSFYVDEEAVRDSKIGDSIEIDGVFHTVTRIEEDGIIYFDDENLCLKKNFKDSEAYAYYGKIPDNSYGLFRIDTGRPSHEVVLSTITLYFNYGAFVTVIERDENGVESHALSSAEELLSTDIYGNLFKNNSYGYIRLENGMVYSYLELP